MDGDERVVVEDAHQARVPAHAEPLAEQRERHRIERAGDFDVAIGVDGPLAGREERKGVAGERLQRALLDLDEMRPDLATRRAVNAEARDRPIPLAQERIVRLETLEAAAFQRVALDVAAAALLLTVFLRPARLRRQRREAPVRREREIDVVAVGIVEAGAHDRGFEIVVADDARDAAEVAERALVQRAGTWRASDPTPPLRSRAASGPASSETPTADAIPRSRRRASGAPRKKSTCASSLWRATIRPIMVSPPLW